MPQRPALLHAVHAAARKLSSSGDFDRLLLDVLTICVEAVGAEGGTIYLHDPAKKKLQFRHVLPMEVAELLPFKDIPDDFGIAGKVFSSQKTDISNFEVPEESDRSQIEQATRVVVRTMITVPLMMEDEPPIGVVQLINKIGGPFDTNDSAVLDTVSAISTMAYMNSQLLAESTRASQLLGMGKVAHDIKNLAFALEANLSSSDYTITGMRNEIDQIGGKHHLGAYIDAMEGMLEELNLSIERVKRYSILISDLSAGKELKPVKKVAPLADTIELSAAYLESEGRKHHIALTYDIQRDAPPLFHDEMYLFRIVQNLVSNAIKASGESLQPDATPLRGDGEDAIYAEVQVRYRFCEHQHVIEVEDRGPGMTEDTKESILRGLGRSIWRNASGSGWGMKIVLELAATHNAKVDIDSELGVGSTFRVIFPNDQA